MASVPLTEFGPMVRAAREAKGWSQEALAAEALGNSTRKGYISDVENAKYSGISAMTAQRLIDALGLDKSLITRLRGVTPPDNQEIDAEISRLRAQLGGLEAALADLQHQSRDTLIALATRFGQAEAHLIPDGSLRAYLADRAQDHVRYQKIIDALDDRVAAIANLKGAAKDAAARLDFDEVEFLLSRVQEVELDIAAATAEARAENALMQGKADHAFTLYAAAADSFAGTGPVEVAKRRRSYAERLEEHGTRYGGQGLTLAIRLFDRLLTDLPREAAPWDWAAAQNSLAITCRNLGTRTQGPPGAALLSLAVTAYEAALQVSTRADHPVHWAITMQNLAIALGAQGERTEGQAGTDFLARAVTAYEAALQVRTRADHPVHWARTMQNLANALQAQGARTAGQAGTDLLASAVTAYEAALQVRTRADHPVHWATTMQNLAGALQRQGGRTEGLAGTDLLSRAVKAYEDALQVRTRADHPVDWAGTMHNLAGALQAQGERTEGQAGTDLLSRAVAAYEAALQVRTRADHPVDWAMTQENLAGCHAAWAQHPACDDPAAHLGRALEHVDAALTIYDPDHMDYHHAKATSLRAIILTDLAATG